ncbi:glycosyltransferase family 4 protein [bacterium]|nr:glycosyltransferase family 4 protein [bacterium]
MRIPVTLFIGEKTFVEKGDKKMKTGYKRHYESDFFKYLDSRVKFNIQHLYPLKGDKYSVFRHLANHFIHPFKFRKEFKKNVVKHIMFGEEAFMLNFLSGDKTVVSCLDVIPLAMPKETSWKFRLFLRWAYRGMKKADYILANSKYTRDDIVKYLKIDKEKIFVAYPAIQEQFKVLESPPELFYNSHGLLADKKYLLYVGALDAHRKNLTTALKAFKKVYFDNHDVHFLLVGYASLRSNLRTVKKEIDKLGLAGKVHIITNVPDEELVAFYNLAKILIFPSLYEGFGLPPLEAMACGTPVIASNVTSIPEALGDAAIFVDPLDIDGFVNGINRLLFDEELYDKMVARGMRQAEKYTWKRYCDDTYKVYEAIWK